MCGIFGWVQFAGDLTDSQTVQARLALGRLSHRGPDNQGEWREGGVFLGHRRLSIIDLSDAANQPFHDPDRRYALVFNGEIYNYLELRAELEAAGRCFLTDSDTEVLLAAYAQWGVAALTRFDGMFAAGLHDCQTGGHVVIRDPLGQKPLYYAVLREGVVYASELGALLGLAGIRWTIDRAAFRRYLMHSYYAWDETPVREIRKLPPGHMLRIEGGRATVERYWDSVPGAVIDDMSDEEALAGFERLFGGCCAQSMRSDVPYGVLLSGGLDSTLVLQKCIAIQADVRTFSIAMGEADFDESAKARAVAAHLGVRDHHSFLMDDSQVVASMEGLFKGLDEPHGDPGYVNAYFLAQSCRPHLTVALGGDGGDELFAGYAPFAGLGPVPLMRRLPAPVLAALRWGVGQLPAGDGYLGLRFKAEAYLQGFPVEDAMRCSAWLSTLGIAELERIAPAEPGEEGLFANIGRLMAPVAGRSLQQQMLYYYQKIFLPEFVCMHTDRATMRFGLEARSPFLSLPLVEFANRLPDRMRIRDGERKWLLKRSMAAAGYPEGILNQRKQGFTFPLARWLKGSLRRRLEECVKDHACWDGLVDRHEVARLAEEHLAGRRNLYRILYNLMAFRQWRSLYPDCTVS